MLNSGIELELVPGTVFPEIEFSDVLRFIESLLSCVGFFEMVKFAETPISLVEGCFHCYLDGNLSLQSKNYQFL